MRIVIDLQGAQTGSRFRGIGRYSLNFALALARQAREHELFIALNAAFADSIEPIRAAFDGLLPQERILVWEVPGPVRAIDPEPDQTRRRHAAECIREAFLARLQPDWVIVPSLFEGFLDDAVTSIGRHLTLPTAVVLHDLIPLIHRDIYLAAPVVEAWYEEKLDHLRRADLLLANSQSSGREAIDHLGFEREHVVVVGAGCDARFRPLRLDSGQRARLRLTYGLERPFIMYTGGIDHRKNIEGLIRAYARLPQRLREQHQLAIVCAVQDAERARLQDLARAAGLSADELVLTGFVPDEDLLLLYNACSAFVFPSWHEGFGLPVLEAMRCGKAVLAANTSSLPEVVGRDDALFDPHDEQAMAAQIERVLTDTAFRQDLERHGFSYSQRFSWEETARRALAALQQSRRPPQVPMVQQRRRPRLAYVSPLPPERSGIADYSAELIPELARWYELELIVNQAEVGDARLRALYPVRTVEAFRAASTRYDRVLYHFGNSEFHNHMFALLDEIPGVVVLHDFFLSGIQAYRDVHGWQPHAWAQALLESHGYHALRERYTVADTAEVVWRYPASLPVLQAALGVIVHSEHSRDLARQWYGPEAGTDWAVVPLLRAPVLAEERQTARQALGLADEDLLVCAFGVLGPHKLNHRLLEAWLASPLKGDARARLVFVGQNEGGAYGQALERRIHDPALGGRVSITGWVDTKTYRRYLAAADIAAQLRTLSRGETSASVLDCLGHGLATIINAHGSLAELDPAAVWMLPDDFSDAELAEALATLADDAQRRRALGEAGQRLVRERHVPRRCAALYAEAIERFYHQADTGLPGVLSRLAGRPLASGEQLSLATSLARDFPPAPRLRQLLVDVSVLVQIDVRSGIQRVVRAILNAWLSQPPQGWRIEPVFTGTGLQGYRYARRWTCAFLGVPADGIEDAPAEAWPGDVFVGLDLNPVHVPEQRVFLERWRHRGVRIHFVVYDLLPVLLPRAFQPEEQPIFERWLETIARFDGAICISRAVADELEQWLATRNIERSRPFQVGWFHLGADVARSLPTTGLPADAEATLAALAARPSFLMVGTIEPRKGHAQTLAAFERLWRDGVDVNLVIVGKQGWMVDSLIERLRGHAQAGRRLFWLEGVSDEYLEKVYATATCLIAASEGEGFGLPLIEAAQHGLPIIARDIPVFREVAGEHAYYFTGKEPEDLTKAIRFWLMLHRENKHPRSDGMTWQTWQQSAAQLLAALGLTPDVAAASSST